jgi:hypothetical protein
LYCNRIVLARDASDGWDKHGGHTLYPALGFCVDQFGRSRQEYLSLFEYDSARTVNIIADMTKLSACLEDNEVNVMGVVIGNAQNLRGAFDMASDFGTVLMIAAKPLLRYSCGVHTANVVLVDLRSSSQGRWSGSGCSCRSTALRPTASS